MKILVIRFSSIGDIVLTSPVVRCLKNQIPGAEVHFLTKKKFVNLLEHSPFLDKTFSLDNNFEITLTALKKEKYAYVVDLHHNLRSLRVKLELGVKSLSFSKLNLKKWIYVNLKKDVMPPVHIVDRYLDAVKPLGIANDGGGLDFYPCDCDMPLKEQFPLPFRHKEYIVASIGGTHFTKKMPVNQWVSLLKLVGVPVVLVGGKEDQQTAAEIESGFLKTGIPIWNACGKFNVGGSAHLIRNSKMVISHDTGMMHIAVAFKKPVVAIWGNTTPKLGMSPYQVPHFNLEVNGLSCRPCSKIGYKQCPKGHFRCMTNQDFNQEPLLEFIHFHLSK